MHWGSYKLIVMNVCICTIFVNLNTPNSQMKKKRNFALGRHSITPLGQLYRRSQIHEPKAIKLQQIQFYICRIKHIWYTHEETTLHCPEETRITLNWKSPIWPTHSRHQSLLCHWPILKAIELDKCDQCNYR